MRVLVSGAGIAGPTVAYFLAKAGAKITIVDKAPALLPHGQNIDLQGSSISVVKRMGLLEAIRRNNTTEQGTQLVDENGRTLASFPLVEGHRMSVTSEFEILRGDLSKVLYEPTSNDPNVDYLFDTTVKKVISNDDTSVKVQFSNGQVHEYDVLIIADGQWSGLRKQCFSPGDLTVVDKNMYAAYFTVPRLPSDNGWWTVHMSLQSRLVTTRPDPHGTYRAMLTKMPRNDAEKRAWQEASRASRKMQQELLRMEFAGAGWETQRLLDAMDQAPDFYFQAVQQVKMARWSSGRVVLLGDAAYCPTPLTGQGAPLAINGAYVLAGELSKLKDGDHPSKAFQEYDKTFRPWVEEQQKIPFFFPGAVHPGNNLHRWLFNNLIWLVSLLVKVPWVTSFIGGDQSEDVEDFKLPLYPKF